MMRNNQQMPDATLSIWAALSDSALEHRLRHYLWQQNTGSGRYHGRVGQLAAEAERRGKPEIVQKAKDWVAKSGTAPLL